ncbi:MAG TPA: hypothetical protein VK474_00410, partial [Chthoniobacterales bacterium]|nr:hypothetical protein [Chthoniobacterales bacterium]
VLDTARYLTFQRPLTGLPADISRFTQRQPWMKLFLPFIRTPTNIFKYAIERSPFAPVLKEVRANFAASGERRALATARMALGTGLGMTVAQWAADGTITGSGPTDQRQRALMMADGWQPYSIRLGDTYYSYQRLDPLAMTLGTAANLSGTWTSATQGELTEAGSQLIASVIGNLSDKTWLSSLGDLMQAMSDPQRYLESFISRLAGSVAVPTGVAQVARWMDPTMRETDGPLERIQSRIPGLSDDLPARRDVWGQPIVGGGGAGPDLVSPIWTSEARNDPVIAELLNIGATIGRPSRRIRGAELPAAEWGQYQEMSGRYIRDDLIAAIGDPDWQGMTVPERVAEVTRIKRVARADARADVGLYQTDDDEEPGARPGPAQPASAALPPLPPGFELQAR